MVKSKLQLNKDDVEGNIPHKGAPLDFHLNMWVFFFSFCD